MLHLAVIGLVCAVSAPSEGSAFNERKNNESNIFCHFDGGGRNIAKISLPNVYDVVFRNSSDPGEEKFPNRSSSFFYEYFIKQYQDNKNSSCSIMESVSSGKKKKFRSKIGFLKRKKRFCDDVFDTTKPKKGFKVTPKTLRPPIRNYNCKGKNNVFNRKPKIKPSQEMRLKCKTDLTCDEKKMFFRLKNLRKRPRCCTCRKSGRACKRHLDRLKVDDDLDLNKRIEKLVKQIAIENQRKEHSAKTLALVKDAPKGGYETLSLIEKPSKKDSSFPFFNHIKKIFSFSKNYFHNKIAGNVVSSVPVNSKRGKYLVSDKAAHISSYDVLKTMHKTTRLRRNPYKSHTPFRQNYNPVPVYKNELNEKYQPHSTNFKGKINALHPRFRRKCSFQNLNRKKNRIKKRGMNKRERKIKNFQLFKKFNFQNHDSRLRREDYPTLLKKPNRKLIYKKGVPAKDSKASLGRDNQTPLIFSQEPITEKILVKGNEISPQFTKFEATTTNSENEVHKNTDQFSTHTLERPFLERYFRKEKFRKENPSLGYESATEIPSTKYKYEPSVEELTPARYLKIRHALRNFLIHNNVFGSKGSNRSVRKKRCEVKTCSRSHKCWRSAPLLCLPYIKKCQEDQLKYIIRVLQSMIGKPFPPRVDIFERTKFKPTLRPDNDDCGNPSDDYCLECSPTPPCSTTSRPLNWFPSVCPPTCAPPCPPAGPPPCPPSSPPPCPSGSPPPPPPTCPPCTPRTCPTRGPPAFATPCSLSAPLTCPPPSFPTSPPPCPPICPDTCPVVCPQTCATPTCAGASSSVTYIPTSGIIYSTSSYPYPVTPSCHISAATEGCLSSQELPISFPVLGQGADPTTSCCNYDDFVTTQLPYAYTADSISHIPVIPTMPLTPPPTTCPSSWASSGKAPLYSRSSLVNSSPAFVPFYTTASPRYSPAGPPPTTPFRCLLTPSGNTCGYHNSDSPIERKEYFSFTAVSFNGPSDIATESFQYAESLATRYPHSNTIQPPGSRFNQKIYPQRTVCNGCLITPAQNPSTTGLQSQHPPPTVHPVVSNGAHNTKFQVKGPSKSFRQRKQLYPEYFFETTLTSNDQSNRKFNANKYKRAELQELDPYEDDFIPPTEHNSEMKYEISKNRLFRMHHKGNPKPHYRSINTLPDYEYDFYDKYPEESRRLNEARFSRLPPLLSSWRDYDWKPKEVKKRDTSKKRSKREDDYYVWPEKFESYNDYFDDPGYSEEFLKKHPEADAKINDEYAKDNEESWTPPSFDMFNELAKAVTSISETNTTLDSSRSSRTYNVSSTVNLPTRTNEVNEDRETSETIPVIQISTAGYNNVLACKDKGKVLSKTTNPVTDKCATTVCISSTISKSAESSKSNIGVDVGTTTTASDNRTLKNVKNSKTVCKTKISQSAPDSKSKGKKTTKSKATEKTTTETLSGMRCTTVTSKVTFKEDKRSGRKQKQNTNPTEEGQVPTTLKMASIAKGPKKCTVKPSPKIYVKVFPETLNNEANKNKNTTSSVTRPAVSSATFDATRPTTSSMSSVATNSATMTAATTKDDANTTTATTATTQTSTTQIDLKLQLLAVCEGYLEVIKLIKAQNQTPAEELDMNLAQYCENIISQSFNCVSDKPKKSEISESAPQLNGLSGSVEFDENLQKFDNVCESGNGNDLPEDVDDTDTEKVVTESVKKKKMRKKRRRKKLDYAERNSTEIATGRLEKRKEKKRNSVSTTSKKKRQEKTEDSEESLKKGVTQEQIEVIKLLTKRKKALLSWLQNTKDETKPDDTKETEYFEDEDLFEPSPDFPEDSGTIKPKRDERTTGRTQNMVTFVNESIFPIYAKQYGYNSGGEVQQVEVVWRKINEKTHEKKIVKNVSVLALLLTSTNCPDIRLAGPNGYEGEENSEILSKSDCKIGFPAKSQPTATTLSQTLVCSNVECKSTAHQNECSTQKSDKKNATRTIITKPDISTIVGKPSECANKTHGNTTRKVSHRFGAAKDLFQECSIEFLDYAVYILPIMFTILFLFCCLCCAVHILHTMKSQYRCKRRKKIPFSSDETTEETTEESEFESKKRKREAKRKRKSKKDGDNENLYNKKLRKFWNVLNPSSCKADGDDKSQTEKKKSFLRFLKCKPNEDKDEGLSCVPLFEDDEIRKHSEDSVETNTDDPQFSWARKKEDEKRKSHEDNEAAERRELIALLEELKKIETEHTGERKEVKSVQVQYMNQEDENSVFQRPDFSYPYDKNVFGLPKGYSFCSNQIPFHQTGLAAAREYELYDDMNELTELLPCQCDYYSKRNNYCDFRMNSGRCEGFLKFLRDSGVSHSQPFLGTNFRKNERKNRTFIFNNYRSINRDENEELIGVTLKDKGTEVRFMENSSPFTLNPQKNADLVEEMENFKRQLKKNVHLKDDGVLCRLSTP